MLCPDSEKYEYNIFPTGQGVKLQGQWDGPVWGKVPALDIAFFRPEGSGHKPVTQVKLLHSPEGLYVIFRIQDQYVRCVHTQFQEAVYKDSCVEFFVQPKPDGGYFNFELNCGGALLASYIVNPERNGLGFKEYTLLSSKDRKQIGIYHSMPGAIDPEIKKKTTWVVEVFIPFGLLEKYTGPLKPAEGKIWRANFYKCGDDTSHPHWGAWAPVDELNFHLPRCFGSIRFRSFVQESSPK